MKTWPWILCFVPFLISADQDAIVRLVDRISVQAPTITLGEIARIETIDSYLRRQLQKLEIVAAPKIKSPAIVTAYRIKALLQRVGINNVAVVGSQSTVFTESTTYSASDIESLVENWIRNEVDEEDDLSINFVRSPDEWEIPAGNQVEIHLETRRKNIHGQVNIVLQARIGNRSFSEIRVQTQVDRYEHVAIVTRPLKRGETITENHVAIHRSQSARNSALRIRDLDRLIGKVASKTLEVGRHPTIKDVEEPVVISRGSKCRIQVINREIKLQVRGAIALQDGKAGETILFTNPMNGKENLRAKVLKPGLALIHIQ